MRLYIDASALIKLLISEEGGDEAREVWRHADRVISARTVLVEARSAVTRRLQGRPLARARRDLSEILARVEFWEIDEALIDEAGAIAERFRLRTLDAIHLAAATEIDDPRLVMATWDRELSRAASSAGLTVFP